MMDREKFFGWLMEGIEMCRLYEVNRVVHKFEVFGNVVELNRNYNQLSVADKYGATERLYDKDGRLLYKIKKYLDGSRIFITKYVDKDFGVGNVIHWELEVCKGDFVKFVEKDINGKVIKHIDMEDEIIYKYDIDGGVKFMVKNGEIYYNIDGIGYMRVDGENFVIDGEYLHGKGKISIIDIESTK